MEKNDPVLSIIILSYNTEKITRDCLTSIFTSLDPKKLAYEIIVLDNASKDNSTKMLQEMSLKHKNLHVILNKENIGFGRGNNQAVKKAKGQYLLLLNSDTLILDNAIEKTFNYYVAHEKTQHFLGIKLLNADKTAQPSAALFFTLPVLFAFLFLKGDTLGVTRTSPDVITKTDWVSGACIMCKKQYFQDINGFDEEIFMYMEEVDLLYRAKQAGFDTYFYPDAKIIHIGSASSNKTYPILQAYRGFLYFYKKHGNRLSLFLLKIMLKLKAAIAYTIGKVLKNQYLIQTYEQAYKMVDMV